MPQKLLVTPGVPSKEVGPPDSLLLLTDRDEMPADGSSRALLTATVTDASGIAVPSAAVEFRTNGAEADIETLATTDESGRAEVFLTAGHEAGPVAVTAQVDGISFETI